ncbi:hypothetical protein ElyMa_006008700 [Elysia marginata]|uniref:Uncharacterized protein n=1 Tax=Elysia marginata TaxID=1093978 RepID=A0AAV4GI64_9GAST|nr:hypothetical protein ElyMa_006008700 [Elysia marginata]
MKRRSLFHIDFNKPVGGEPCDSRCQCGRGFEKRRYNSTNLTTAGSTVDVYPSGDDDNDADRVHCNGVVGGEVENMR